MVRVRAPDLACGQDARDRPDESSRRARTVVARFHRHAVDRRASAHRRNSDAEEPLRAVGGHHRPDDVPRLGAVQAGHEGFRRAHRRGRECDPQGGEVPRHRCTIPRKRGASECRCRIQKAVADVH
ncbi:conserved hypothetical protein [Ricinus communis]|uniref:Uncharacterized protein n=1 Tax=Ricinus communis TaxID=3988 RepID=B9TAQ2_RICCO|nr:conserved hypothetical protein [Ricinus communis]